MQQYDSNGILVGLKRNEYGFYVEVKMIGKLLHKDYLLALPVLKDALGRVYDPEIKILVDGRKLNKRTSITSWHNINFGMKYHKNEFAKLAYIGKRYHEKLLVRFSHWFTNGDVEFFEKYKDAVRWLEK